MKFPAFCGTSEGSLPFSQQQHGVNGNYNVTAKLNLKITKFRQNKCRLVIVDGNNM